MKSFVTLLKNELKLNIRNMNMVIFAVIIPLVVLIILGFIYGTKPAADGTAYTFFGAILWGRFVVFPFVLEDSWGYPLWYQNTENEKF
mgnify:CR=1 FL=1